MDIAGLRSKWRITLPTLLVLSGLLIANGLGFVLYTPAPAKSLNTPSAEVEPTLRLLKELSTTERDAMVGPEGELIARVNPQRLEPAPLDCRIWGPFSDTQSLEPLRVAISEVGEVIEVRESQIQDDPDFLVNLQTDNNVDKARRILKELQSQSIEAYILAGGPYANSVSVGVFSEENRARRHMNRVSELGFDVEIQPLLRNQTVFFLVGSVPEEFRMEPHQYTPCTTIASTQ